MNDASPDPENEPNLATAEILAPPQSIDAFFARLGSTAERLPKRLKQFANYIAANPDKVEQARAKPTLAGWFVGQVMKASQGKANPQAVQALVKEKLGVAE